jgi:predicted alpha-1,2-mannosidase
MTLGNGTSRRVFLKLGSALAIASSEESFARLASPLSAPEAPGNGKSEAGAPAHLADLVNPLQGTDSTPLLSRGNTLPIIALPFAMAHWAPQSTSASNWFFLPHDMRFEGVRCTHQLSPWLGDYGHATFLPFTGDPSPEPSARASSYRAAELQIALYLLKMRLARYGCLLELAPTERCSIMRFTYQDSGPAGIFIDLPGENAEAHCDLSSGTVTAFTRANNGGVQSNFAAYYFVKLDQRIGSFEVKELNGRRVAVLRFAAEMKKPVNLRVGTSFISLEQAALNLAREIGEKPFETVREEAAAVWEHALGRVRIQGGTEAARRTFYSCLYRTLLFPRMWHEPDASGNLKHRSPYTGLVEPGVLYADHGFWDDYHVWYPMLLLLYPERHSEILQGWVNAFTEGGWFPQFPCPGYRGGMTGSLIDSVFGDAAAKGIKGFDLETAYRGLKKHATQLGDPARGYGRQGLEAYLKLGYVPCDQVGGAAVQTLDFAYGDFCIAQVARALGIQQDARMFEERSRNWRNIFDPKTRFFRGKQSNGEWLEPFDPYAWGGAYVEGSAWQYRFDVLHDPEGLMECMGGKAQFLAHLEEMLSQPPIFHAGAYGAEIHEMSEMAAVDFGQYAHSNQPVHNLLYMFTAAGRRDRTQYWAHRVLKELYSPDNFPGDEDTGSMSAWYILSSLGIFPLCPGKPEWTLGAPYFKGADIEFPDGRRIHIEAKGDRGGEFYRSVSLNGNPHPSDSISHAELMKEQSLIVFQAS